MAEYDNTNRWTLNKNDRRRNDKDAEYTGSINIDGVDYWLNAWVKDGKRGKFFSGTVRPKQAASTTSDKPLNQQLDDDIPF